MIRIPGLVVRLADVLTQFVYHLSGGRIGGKQAHYSMLLLETVGRKTGKPRTHTLLYVRDEENFVIIASNNGGPRHPAWYHNLLAHPQVWVQAGQVHTEVLAETAAGKERERLWGLLLKVHPQYVEYRKRTAREFPIVVLKPVMSLRDV
jgi:deazaflavin-dependent oxidoreductase (nitroreductase family)